MKILIIGSKGFIGSHCKKYFSDHHDVLGCDIVLDYNEQNYVIIDGSNADYSPLFQTKKFDICINCSGAASVPHSLEYPLRDFTLNTFNVYKILDAIRRFNPTCKFINLSSAAVYGNPKVLPIVEYDSELNPLSPYGLHKLNAEQICKEFYEHYGVKTSSLRIFSAYGEGLKKQLFWDLYQKSLLPEDIKLFGNGLESRDFIYISDLIQAIYLVIQKGEFDGEAINVANGKEVRILDVVEQFYKTIGLKREYQFLGNVREGDPRNWVADISELNKMGYKTQISIEKGINRYYEWIKKL